MVATIHKEIVNVYWVQGVQVSHRIMQLGGIPIMDPSKLLQISGCGYKEPPSDPNNLKQVIQEGLMQKHVL